MVHFRLSALVRTLLATAVAVALLAAPSAASADPGLSPTEAWMLGAINNARAQNGLPGLQESMTLNRAADEYTQFLAASGAEGHFADGRDPTQRAHAHGWPGAGAGEVYTIGDAPLALDDWLNSAGHRATLLSPDLGAAGIAEVDGIWIVMAGDHCPSADGVNPHPGCGLTGFYGNANQDIYRLVAEEMNHPSGWKEYCPRMWDPKPAQCNLAPREGSISFSKLSMKHSKRGRTVTVKVTTVRAAAKHGTLSVMATRRGQTKKLKSRAYKSLSGGRVQRTYRVRLKAGKWLLRATYDGRGRWRDSRRLAPIRVR